MRKSNELGRFPSEIVYDSEHYPVPNQPKDAPSDFFDEAKYSTSSSEGRLTPTPEAPKDSPFPGRQSGTIRAVSTAKVLPKPVGKKSGLGAKKVTISFDEVEAKAERELVSLPDSSSTSNSNEWDPSLLLSS